MNTRQRQILQQAAKTSLKGETILGGSSQHINPIFKNAIAAAKAKKATTKKRK